MSLIQAFGPAIHVRLPWLSFHARAMVDALLLEGGSVGRAREVAERLGLHSRFRLAELLRANGLPPLHRLSVWVMVLAWAWQWEDRGRSLSDAALVMGKEPAAAYRLVQRLTGSTRSEVRARGTQWLVSQFLRECGDVSRKRRNATLRNTQRGVLSA